jgi:hypothetical protein
MDIELSLTNRIKLLPKYSWYFDGNVKKTFEFRCHFLFIEFTIKKF